LDGFDIATSLFDLTRLQHRRSDLPVERQEKAIRFDRVLDVPDVIVGYKIVAAIIKRPVRNQSGKWPVRIDPVICPALVEIAEITLKEPGSNEILRKRNRAGRIRGVQDFRHGSAFAARYAFANPELWWRSTASSAVLDRGIECKATAA
jgi:hypothetical protein